MPFFQPIAGCDIGNTETTIAISADAPTASLRTFRVNDSPKDRIDAIDLERTYFSSGTRFISNDDWWVWRIVTPSDSNTDYYYYAKTWGVLDYRWELFEGGSVSGSFTSETWFNRYRPSSNTTSATVAQRDTNSASSPVSGGTLIAEWRMDAFTDEGAQPWHYSDTPIFALKPSTTYFLAIYPDNRSQWLCVHNYLTERPIVVPMD